MKSFYDIEIEIDRSIVKGDVELEIDIPGVGKKKVFVADESRVEKYDKDTL